MPESFPISVEIVSGFNIVSPIPIITRIDRKAFVTVHKAHEINGEGFSPLEKK